MSPYPRVEQVWSYHLYAILSQQLLILIIANNPSVHFNGERDHVTLNFLYDTLGCCSDLVRGWIWCGAV